LKQPPAIGFPYRASHWLVAATIVMALLAMVAVGFSAAPYWARLVAPLPIGVYAGTALARLLKPRVRSVLWRSDGVVALTLRGASSADQRETQGTVQSARWMGPLIVLTLDWPPRGRATLWLLPDNLDHETHRRLRMRLGVAGSGSLASGNADSG
jgi:toxin CptA